MSKYRHQGFVLQGDSQEGVELELNFSSLRSNNPHHSNNRKQNATAVPPGAGADSFSAADDSLYSVSSSDSWELDRKFDALRQIREKKPVIEFDNIYDEDTFDSDYYDNENGNRNFASRCMDHLRNSSISRKKLAIVGLMVAMIVVGAIFVSVYVAQEDDRGSTSSIVSGNTVPDYTEGMSKRERDVFEVLQSLTPPHILADETGAQYAAFQFVANDDVLQVPTVDPELVYRLNQRYILGAMYYSTNGGNWTESANWMSGTSECEWYGIVCTDSLYVQQVLLSTNNLAGEIAPELGKFEAQYLLKVVMDHNKLVGTLPKDLNRLNEMLQFEVDDNALTGPIDPSIFAAFKKMIRIEFQYNSLTGTIPTTVGQMAAIEKLHLYSNSLNGTIPEEIGSCLNISKYSFIHITHVPPLKKIYYLIMTYYSKTYYGSKSVFGFNTK